MSKPYIHACASAKRYGGKPEDYQDIHDLMDSPKSCICDVRSRALTHNSWFIYNIVEKVFGVTRINNDGRRYSTRTIAEEHCAEDFGGKFVPSAQDYLQEIEIKEWMNNGRGTPPSFAKLKKQKAESRLIKYSSQD